MTTGDLTQKEAQALAEHITAMHRRPKPMGPQALARWHANEHHRYRTNHYHEGVNLGPDQRPPGWRTGEGAVLNT